MLSVSNKNLNSSHFSPSSHIPKVLQVLAFLKEGNDARAELAMKKLKPEICQSIKRKVYNRSIFGASFYPFSISAKKLDAVWKAAEREVKMHCIESVLQNRVDQKLRKENRDAQTQETKIQNDVSSRFHRVPSDFYGAQNSRFHRVLNFIGSCLPMILFPPYGIYAFFRQGGFHALFQQDSSLHKFGLAHAQGKRPSMEDEHLVTTITSPFKEGINAGTLEFFGIFDGHGGRSAATFGKAHFARYFKSALKKTSRAIHKDRPAQEREKMERVAIFAALKQACQDLNASYMGSAGSTVSVAIKIGSHLWVCNVGDARTIAVQGNGKVIQLTEDQKCDNPKYITGVHKAGGSIIGRRVNGILAVPRALGDKDLPILHTPKITCIPIDQLKGGKLVIACDGLWDVVSSDTVGSYVHKERGRQKDQQLAESLVGKAYALGSTDNISALVVSL